MKRGHPFNIFQYISRFLFILILPVLRSLLLFSGNFAMWIKTAWLDIAAVCLLLLLAFLQWFFLLYRVDARGIMLYRRFPFRRQLFIPARDLSFVSYERPMLLRIFRVGIFTAGTDARHRKRPDFSLVLSLHAAGKALIDLQSSVETGTVSDKYYKPSNAYVALVSAILSNSFAGVVFLSAFISNSGKVLGNQFEDLFLGAYQGMISFMSVFLPPATAALSTIILAGFGISFLLNFVKNYNFTIYGSQDILHIRSGLISQQHQALVTGRINYVDYMQNLITKIVGIYTVVAHNTGCQGLKHQQIVLVPAAGKGMVAQCIQGLLPRFQRASPSLRVRPGATFRYCYPPFLMLAASAYGTILLSYWVPVLKELIAFAGFLGCLISIWLFVVRAVAVRFCGIGSNAGHLTLYYCKGLRFHTISLPAEAISQLIVRKTPFSRPADACDLIIVSRGSKTNFHRVNSVSLRAVEALVEELGRHPEPEGQKDSGAKSAPESGSTTGSKPELA